MAISLSGINGVQQQPSLQNVSAKLQEVIASLSSGDDVIQSPADVASLSVASQLQSQTSGLRQISTNLAQAYSLTQIADEGVAQVQDILGQLQALASEASGGTLSVAARAQLNKQFQQLAGKINTVTGGTSFNGKSVLDGSLTGDNALSLDNLLSVNDNAGGNPDLAIGDLSTGSLFGGQNLDLSSVEGAQQAFTAIGDALDLAGGVRQDISSFQQTVDFSAANIDSAITNQEAAQSLLQETDLTASAGALADTQQSANAAAAAQGNRLNPALLQLIG